MNRSIRRTIELSAAALVAMVVAGCASSQTASTG
jgi:hypothetical protein